MTGRLWLAGVIFAVPLIGFAAAEGLRAHANSELRAAIRQEIPDADPARVAALNLDQLCDGSDSGLDAVCSEYATFGYMATGAVVAGTLGVGLLAAISAAGLLARRSRTVLLNTFKPGLYLTGAAVIVLIATHAVIAMATIWFGESALTGRVHGGIILAIGLGGAAGVAAVAKNTFTMVTEAKTFVFGEVLNRDEEPQLYARIDQLAKRIDALAPDHIVVGLDPNFFVTEAHVTCLGSPLVGRTLYCSLPLCRIMTPSEFDAVIGHELGHFRGLDTQFSQQFYPIYRGTADSLAALQAAGAQSTRIVALLPAIGVFTYLYEAFAVAESRHSRQREFEADRQGAVITSSPVMASALVKVHAFSHLWRSVQESAVETLRGGQVYVNISSVFADLAGDNATIDALDGIGGQYSTHPTDSHPPLESRLESLNVSWSEVTSAALAVSPVPSAGGLIGGAEKIEKRLSDTYQAFLARQAEIASGESEEPTGAA